ncbi:hypothetical protein ATANTOWER_025494 [Ataeniobius toweri]|uniref:Uncharacterized protein n=1 Tax=Ataeniobius toweri TaxID=208326 RepID=A0ABU7BKR2_9TELE|nr:hypothetical protein [Ataeniobius toweri]
MGEERGDHNQVTPPEGPSQPQGCVGFPSKSLTNYYTIKVVDKTKEMEVLFKCIRFNVINNVKMFRLLIAVVFLSSQRLSFIIRVLGTWKSTTYDCAITNKNRNL